MATQGDEVRAGAVMSVSRRSQFNGFGIRDIRPLMRHGSLKI